MLFIKRKKLKWWEKIETIEKEWLSAYFHDLFDFDFYELYISNVLYIFYI